MSKSPMKFADLNEKVSIFYSGCGFFLNRNDIALSKLQFLDDSIDSFRLQELMINFKASEEISRLDRYILLAQSLKDISSIVRSLVKKKHELNLDEFSVNQSYLLLDHCNNLTHILHFIDKEFILLYELIQNLNIADYLLDGISIYELTPVNLEYFLDLQLEANVGLEEFYKTFKNSYEANLNSRVKEMSKLHGNILRIKERMKKIENGVLDIEVILMMD